MAKAKNTKKKEEAPKTKKKASATPKQEEPKPTFKSTLSLKPAPPVDEATQWTEQDQAQYDAQMREEEQYQTRVEGIDYATGPDQQDTVQWRGEHEEEQ